LVDERDECQLLNDECQRVSWVGTGRVAIPPSGWKFQHMSKYVGDFGQVLRVSALHYSTGNTEGSEGIGHWLQLMRCA